MSEPITLIPLKCVKCETPVPAQSNEVAWVCANCQTGLLLDEERGLKTLEFHYAASLTPGKAGYPYWVALGKVDLDRNTYNTFGKKSGDAEQFWSVPRHFFIPAFECKVDDLVNIATHMIENPPELKAGSPADFQPVTIGAEDVQAVAEYVVVGVEAQRKDKVKKIEFKLELQPPELWILP